MCYKVSLAPYMYLSSYVSIRVIIPLVFLYILIRPSSYVSTALGLIPYSTSIVYLYRPGHLLPADRASRYSHTGTPTSSSRSPPLCGPVVPEWLCRHLSVGSPVVVCVCANEDQYYLILFRVLPAVLGMAKSSSGLSSLVVSASVCGARVHGFIFAPLAI